MCTGRQHSLWMKYGEKRKDLIPILQLARSERKKETKIWIKKDGFKFGSRLDRLKNSRNILG